MFIDANIFLEIALENENQVKCELFLRNLIDKKVVFYTSDFVVYSCLIVLQSRPSPLPRMNNFLGFIANSGVAIIRPNLKTLIATTKVMEDYGLDYDDALVLGCMQEYGLKELVSYDKHFEKLNEVKIIRP